MSNYWNQPGIPHKGWKLRYVYDLRGDGQSEEETDYATCMMCNKEKIRYVHVLTHPEVQADLEVGCICASKMTDDYETPKRMENELRKKSSRRSNWIKKAWNKNQSGNFYLKLEGHYFLIYKDKKTEKFRCKLDTHWGKKTFDTVTQAKTGLFNGMELLKDKGQW